MTASGDIVDAPRTGDFLLDASSWRVETLKYGSAMLVIAATVAASAIVVGHSSQTEDASEVDTAVMIDLPPAASSSVPASDAADGPPQTPAAASTAPQPEKTIEPPKPIETPEPQPDTPPVPLPPAQPQPPAVIEEHHEATPTPPPTVAAPSSVSQDEHAPAGSETPTKNENEQGDEGRPHASAHAITQWQRSLMRRLELAKRAFGRETQLSGTVKIAFQIDDRGALVSEHITQSSGSTTLDRAASALVHQAAPFPAPPAGASRREMSFIVPILFRH